MAETTGQGGSCACVSGAAVGTTIVLSSVFTRLPSAERGIFGPEIQYSMQHAAGAQPARCNARGAPNNNKGLCLQQTDTAQQAAKASAPFHTYFFSSSVPLGPGSNTVSVSLPSGGRVQRVATRSNTLQPDRARAPPPSHWPVARVRSQEVGQGVTSGGRDGEQGFVVVVVAGRAHVRACVR